jgi:tetratricopeptide (TPR) repeat protein
MEAGVLTALKATIDAFDFAMAQSDRAKAEECAADLLRRWPSQGAILHAVAIALSRFDNSNIALIALRAACATSAVPAQWLVQLAIFERHQGSIDDALTAAEAAIAKDPCLVDAWLERAAIYLAREEPAAAAEAYDRAFALGASTFALHVNRSAIAVNFGQMDVALMHAEAAIACDPSSLVAQINAAMIEGPVRGYEVALARLETAGLACDDPSLHRARAATLLQLKHFDLALAVAEQAVAGDPQHPLGHELRLAALKSLGRDAEAIAIFDEPVVLALSAPRLLVHRAALKMDGGDREGARVLLRSALARDPGLAVAWFHLGEIADFDTEGADIGAMEGLLEGGARTAFDRVQLHFALGKAHLARDDYPRAIAHFGHGNIGKRRLIKYDVARDERMMANLAREFSAPVLAQVAPNANRSERPIFVLGMPRSGTSLVEQLLASHPAVYGAGELLAMAQAAAQRGSVARDEWPLLAARYLETAGADAGDAERVVDKLPLNFVYVGLIRILFPKARIIHCRRDAVDNGLSCYATLFDKGHEFSYDLTELGRFARAYTQLMDHWRATLPPDRFLEVDYEAIVADVETEARRLVAFCGLPWNDAVLRFYDTRRAVRTASQMQVRRPIYRTSINRALAFGSALDPLRDALAGRSPSMARRP